MRIRSSSNMASEPSVPASALARSLADLWGVERASTGQVWHPGESWKGALDGVVRFLRRSAPRRRIANRDNASFARSTDGAAVSGPTQSESAMVFSHRTLVPIVKRSTLGVTNEEI